MEAWCFDSVWLNDPKSWGISPQPGTPASQIHHELENIVKKKKRDIMSFSQTEIPSTWSRCRAAVCTYLCGFCLKDGEI